jgi:hypothetical protein
MDRVIHFFSGLNLLFFSLFFLGSYTLSSQDSKGISEGEIKTGKKIKFQNKEQTKAPPSKKNKDIEIGSKLSESIDKKSKPSVFGVEVSRHPTIDEKMGGDIITLSPKFKANHINTIRRILSSYVQTSFSYDTKKSDILTYYILYYNAMHRKNKDFFTKKYTPALVAELNTDFVGISDKYSEWTGKTQIVVPFIKNILKDKKTDLPLSELEDIVNPDIDKNKKETNAKGELSNLIKEKTIEERKLVDEKLLQAGNKETELQKAETEALQKILALKNSEGSSSEEIKKLEQDKEKITQEIQKTLEEKKELSEKEMEIASLEKKLLKDQKESKSPAVESKEPSAKEENATTKAKDSKKDETPAQKLEPQKDSPTQAQPNPKIESESILTKNDPPALDEKKSSSESEVPTSKKKEETPPPSKESTVGVVQKAEVDPALLQKQLEEKTKQLEETAKELIDFKKSAEESKQKSENTVGNKILFLQVVKYDQDSHYTNDLWLLDPDEEEGLYKSPFENICGRDFKVLSTGILVIGFEGQESDNSIHHLVLLKKDDLSVLKVSKENVYWKSQLFQMDGKIYTFELGLDKKIYLSRFSEDLVLEARSSEPVHLNSDITFNKGKIFVTSKLQNANSTSITVLNKEDLTILKNFKPTPKRVLSK